MNFKSSNIPVGSRVSSPSVSSSADDETTGIGHALSDFLLQLEDYHPTIPDAVVAHYLNVSGFESQDPRLIRMVALAAQKFLSDVANDALQHCKTRSSNTTSSHGSSKNPKSSKEKRYVMTMEDLTPALQEYGINARKPHYFV